MTANISQHVISRRHLRSQRGSINSTTISFTLAITVILSVSLLSFFYLGQVQSTATQGSDIQALESRMLELQERGRALELEGAQLRSIQTIEEHVPRLNLVSTNSVSYLVQSPDRVAQAE